MDEASVVLAVLTDLDTGRALAVHALPFATRAGAEQAAAALAARPEVIVTLIEDRHDDD